jgi:predicted ArsR family transcriptional regulator
MKPKVQHPPGSQQWRAMVDYRLRAGFGVEDIAVQLLTKPARVREHVAELRADGTLAKWWPRAGA